MLGFKDFGEVASRGHCVVSFVQLHHGQVPHPKVQVRCIMQHPCVKGCSWVVYERTSREASWVCRIIFPCVHMCCLTKIADLLANERVTELF